MSVARDSLSAPTMFVARQTFLRRDSTRYSKCLSVTRLHQSLNVKNMTLKRCAESGSLGSHLYASTEPRQSQAYGFTKILLSPRDYREVHRYPVGAGQTQTVSVGGGAKSSATESKCNSLTRANSYCNCFGLRETIARLPLRQACSQQGNE